MLGKFGCDISVRIKAFRYCVQLHCCHDCVEIYPQEAESLAAHIHIDNAGSVATQSAPVCVVVVIVDVHAVLAGTEPLVMRPLRIASIKCHFHSGDSFLRASHTDKNFFTDTQLCNLFQLEYSLKLSA